MDVIHAVADRRFLESGLTQYRNYAVEELSWDAEAEAVLAHVEDGGKNHTTSLSLTDDPETLGHDCDCATHRKTNSCPHAVAATAALFLAIQGKSPGGYEMPTDYAQQLREQLLGTNDPSQSEHAEADAETDSQFILQSISAYGHLSFAIEGTIPQAFLRECKIDLQDGRYGYTVSREFSLNQPDKTLKSFLKKAQSAGIAVHVEVGDLQAELTYQEDSLERQLVVNFKDGEVEYAQRFYNQDKKLEKAVTRIEESKLVLLSDGRIAPFTDKVDTKKLDWHPYANFSNLTESGKAFRTKAPVNNFNDDAAVYLEPQPGGLFLEIDGKAQKLKEKNPPIVPVLLDLCPVHDERNHFIGFEYTFYAKVGSQQIDLNDLLRHWFDPFFYDSNRLFSAKKRVATFQSALRRLLSLVKPGDNRIPATLWTEFPELAEAAHKPIAGVIFKHLLNSLAEHTEPNAALAIDPETASWLLYRIDARKIAMLLFSLVDSQSATGLMQLLGGILPVSKNDNFSAALQRFTTVSSALGFELSLEANEVRTAKIELQIEGTSSDDQIDWFALHPSVRCGDRTLTNEEWKQLILGKLLLRDKDGNILVPDMGGDSEVNLQLLTRMLEKQTQASDRSREDSQQPLTISRLEMLDWIALRHSGIQLRLPKEADRLFDSLRSFDQIPPWKKPRLLQATLRGYQKAGCAWINFLYKHRFGACLADDMGLGKTVQAIGFLAERFAKELKDSPKATCLVVVPPSLVFNWLEEFNKFAPGIRVVDCIKSGQWQNALNDAQVVLTTYDRVRVDIKRMRQHHFEIVVFDEAHNLKNISAARTKAASLLDRRFTLCLSGTPVENNETEFFSVMSAAVPGIFGSLKNFRDDFREDPDRILQRAKPFILRRTKGKILKELPPKEEHELFLEMTPMQKEIYTRTVSEVRAEVAAAYEERPEQQAGIVALAAILRLRQVCVTPALLGKELDTPAPKFAYLADQLEELAAEGNAALVFSQFRGGLDAMEVIAKERGIRYLRMDGQTPVAKRKAIVEDFQSEDGPDFFFISLKTGGVGLNLTRANYVFHLDPWWNPSVENQASDRAHRIGQTRSVFVQRLIMQHSIEARMLELKARKAELFNQLIEDPGSGDKVASLSRSDFDYLLNG
jgi:superfamily II DNA or RNA helicase